MTVIDLRSDTVTRPTKGMLAAICSAQVGDDVFGEDPTVNKLEERVAAMLDMESALFVPSGTMSNQIAIRCHTVPGDELICEVNNHIFQYESGGPAALSGVMCQTMVGKDGVIDVPDIDGLVKPDADYAARTRLVCLENTHNRGGGKVFPIENIERISKWARSNNLAMHLDGARLWNAVVATKIPLKTWTHHFHSVSVCFSKGLGAPVGSALAGPKEFIKRARRIRKMFGGGMRQAGILAAAANYALDHHIERLAEDHANAQRLADLVSDIPDVTLTSPKIDTNLLFIKLDPKLGTAAQAQARLQELGLLTLPTAAQTLRFVTHLDVNREQIERAGTVLRTVLNTRRT
ncbi:MAG TPA: low-specificity L-threonine aldolase [Gemmatales bacterium]|nr:low-specificity L-threonine aldolase [Gemmatales bacterium]